MEWKLSDFLTFLWILYFFWGFLLPPHFVGIFLLLNFRIFQKFLGLNLFVLGNFEPNLFVFLLLKLVFVDFVKRFFFKLVKIFLYLLFLSQNLIFF